MAKIYLVKRSLMSAKILEVELIKQTAEQLRIDNKTVQVAWSSEAKPYIPYLSTRLLRRSEKSFKTLETAMLYVLGEYKKDIESMVSKIAATKLIVAELSALLENADKEETDGA